MIRDELRRSRLENSSTSFSSKYASGCFEPVVSHLAASPSPGHEWVLSGGVFFS
jgi:hypothetical protein